MFRSIKVKILILQTGLVLAVAVIIGIATYSLTITTVKKSQQQHLQYSAEHISKNLNSLIKYKKQLLEKIATSEVVESYYKKRDENLLREYFYKFKSQFPILSYVNEDGLEEFKLIDGEASTNYLDIKNSSIYEEAVWNDNTTVSSCHITCPEPGGPYIHLSYCYRNYFDEYVGLILARIPIVQFAAIIHEFKFGQTGFALMVDDEGTVLSSPNKHFLLKKVAIKGPDTKQINAQIKTLKPGTGRVTILGTDSYFACSPVKGQNWLIVTILPYEEFMTAPNRLGLITILVTLIVLEAAVLFSLGMATNIATPISKLAGVTQLVAKGDFTQRVDVNSKDEIGYLGKMFNYMTEHLEKTTTSIDALNAANARLQASQEQLELANKQLINSNQQLQEFIHIASHDLKEPVRKIMVFGQMLKDSLPEKLNEDEKENLDFMLTGANKMKRIVDSLKAYSQIIVKNTSFEQVHLEKIINALIKFDFPMALKDTSGKILVPEPLPVIEGDSIQIRQVFKNIIANSFKYRRKDVPPVITIKAHSQDNGMARIEIEDNGIGIKPEYHEKIFAIFRRLHSGHEYEGIGIGLALCKKIIERHGGEIGVNSTYGTGTTFWLTLHKLQDSNAERKELVSSGTS